MQKPIKILLYSCTFCMAVAGIAGTTDYYKANKKGTMKNLYADEKPPAPVSIVNKLEDIKAESYSRAALPEPPAEKPEVTEQVIAAKRKPVIERKSTKPEVITNENLPKNTRKLSYKSFSRAALPIRKTGIIYIDSTGTTTTVDTAAVLLHH